MKDFLEVVRFLVVLGVLLFVVLGMAIMGCLDGTPPPTPEQQTHPIADVPEQQPFPVEQAEPVQTPASLSVEELRAELAKRGVEPAVQVEEKPAVVPQQAEPVQKIVQQATPEEEPPQAIVITPERLLSEYDTNEVRCDLKYKGKLLELTGTVKSVGRDIGGSAYFTFTKPQGFTFRGVQCVMAPAYANQLANVDAGDTVTVFGTGAGMFGNVLLRHCVLAE